jgi:cyclic lactone autoinducer peptide
MCFYNASISNYKRKEGFKFMKKVMSIVLKQVGNVADKTLSLSANTTSTWIAHQPQMPDSIKKFKKYN